MVNKEIDQVTVYNIFCFPYMRISLNIFKAFSFANINISWGQSQVI